VCGGGEFWGMLRPGEGMKGEHVLEPMVQTASGLKEAATVKTAWQETERQTTDATENRAQRGEEMGKQQGTAACDLARLAGQGNKSRAEWRATSKAGDAHGPILKEKGRRM